MEIIKHIEVRDKIGYIAGRNIKAKMVARLYIWEQTPIETIVQQYDITPAEVHAAIAYYYDNQAILDAEYEQNLAKIKSIGTSLEDFKAKIDSRKQED